MPCRRKKPLFDVLAPLRRLRKMVLSFRTNEWRPILVLATKGANSSRGSHVGDRTLAGQAVDWKTNAGRMTFQLRAPATDIMQTMTL